jgi:hypothetical protein
MTGTGIQNTVKLRVSRQLDRIGQYMDLNLQRMPNMGLIQNDDSGILNYFSPLFP